MNERESRTSRNRAVRRSRGALILLWDLLFRGGSTGGPCPSKDNWKFDATKGEWTRLEECSTPRIYTAMAMLPPLNGSVLRAVLYGGQEKTKSVLAV